MKNLIQTALMEDIGSGDITTDNLIDKDMTGKGVLTAKEGLVLAGLDVAKSVFEFLDPQVRFLSAYKDGEKLKKGSIVLTVEGNLRALFLGERTALNFVQRLSGIATYVRTFVDKLEKKNVRLVDTRKTTPGLRVLEKYAVRAGGAHNHRIGLYDGVLIKDNHIAVCGGVKKAVEKIKKNIPHLLKIEVEVSNLSQVKEALDARADVIMLDNMDVSEIKKAVKLINRHALVEVSGGIAMDDMLAVADSGVNIISMGALTHSARFMDISMRIESLTQLST
jgi:nicotinate-nucleotide pyrophosphorylase (carboxylating)